MRNPRHKNPKHQHSVRQILADSYLYPMSHVIWLMDSSTPSLGHHHGKEKEIRTDMQFAWCKLDIIEKFELV